MAQKALVETSTKKSIRSEDGISLVELALVLPLALLLIAGIIDYGFALREIQAISSAAREGARIAASHARRNVGLNVKCADTANPATSISCAATGNALTILNSDPIANVAKKTACQSIRNSKLTPSDWDVTAEVPRVQEDGDSFDVVTVKIVKNANARNCLICWDSMLSALRGNSESTFTLESPCGRS